MYSNDLICNIIKYINNNYKKEITIEELSLVYSYNRFYIMRLFKKEIGDTIFNYINKLKVYKSIELLYENRTILNISISTGFNSQEYYSEIFKNIIGISPLKLRNLYNLENKDTVITNLNKLKLYFNNIDIYIPIFSKKIKQNFNFNNEILHMEEYFK